MTYRDIEQEALAAEAIREHNVVAMGDGENPHDDDTVRPTLACPTCGSNQRDWATYYIPGTACPTCGAMYGVRAEYDGDFETVTMMSEGRDNAL